jgi:hypothetical protein
MSATMLQMCQQVTAELNLTVPTYVNGNPSQDTQQILALMNGAGYELLKEYDWQMLEKEYRFYTNFVNATATSVKGSYVITNVSNTTGLTTQYSITGYNVNQDTYVASVDSPTQVTMSQEAGGTGSNSVLFAQTIYNLPFDFETITDRTHWDKTKHWEMLGPEDAQQWQWLKSGYISTGPRVRWRILGGTFQIWPPMNTQEYLGFEYRSNAWAQSATGTPQQSLVNDTDTSLFDTRIMVIYTKLKYFQVKGFDTTSLMQDYQRYLSIAKANDKGAPNLSFNPNPSKVLIGWANVPDTGYGT